MSKASQRALVSATLTHTTLIGTIRRVALSSTGLPLSSSKTRLSDDIVIYLDI